MPGAKQVFYGVCLLVVVMVAAGRHLAAGCARAARPSRSAELMTRAPRSRRRLEELQRAASPSTTSASRCRRARSSRVIGPNGAGKTTLFNMIAGVLRAGRGRRSRFDGERIDGLRAGRSLPPRHRRAPSRSCGRSRRSPSRTTSWSARCCARPDVARAARARARGAARGSTCSTSARRSAASLTLPDRKRLEVARALATDAEAPAARRGDGGPAADRDRPHGRRS